VSSDDDVVARAGQWFDFVTQMQREDLEQRKLRYHLLRLTACGMRSDEVPVLLELGRLAFLDLPVADQAERITTDPAAGVLARVIADIVARTASGNGPVRLTMLGAVLGAYLAVARSEILLEAAVDGAIAGASSAWAASMVQELHGAGSWADYVTPRHEDQ
jgi:hypothetical protein